MAEAMWNSLGQGEWTAESAGSKPSGYVHPLALKAIKEIGLSTDGLVSKTVDPFVSQEIDLVVTVCDNAQTACPTLPGAKETLHWPFDDPADAEGTEAEQFVFFQRVREEIQTKIAGYLGVE